MELPPDRRQGHIDDGDVHDVHEHGRDEYDADAYLRIDVNAGH